MVKTRGGNFSGASCTQNHEPDDDADHAKLCQQMCGWTEDELTNLVNEGNVPGKLIFLMYFSFDLYEIYFLKLRKTEIYCKGCKCYVCNGE